MKAKIEAHRKEFGKTGDSEKVMPASSEEILVVWRARAGDKLSVRWRGLAAVFAENDTAVVERAGLPWVHRARRSCCFAEADPWPDPEFECSLPILGGPVLEGNGRHKRQWRSCKWGKRLSTRSG